MRGDGRSAACCFLYACGFAGRPQTVHASPASRRPPMLRRQAADRLRFVNKPQTARVSPTARRPPMLGRQAADRPCFAGRLQTAHAWPAGCRPPMLGQQAADRLRFASKPQTAFCEGCSLLRNFRLRLMGVPPIFLQEKEQPLPNKFVEAVLSL